MKPFFATEWMQRLLPRLLLPLLVAPLLGIGPRSYALAGQMVHARRWLDAAAVQNADGSAIAAANAGANAASIAAVSAASQNAARTAAASLAQAGELAPGRSDLWELAGQMALQSGEPGRAAAYLEQAGAAGELSAEGRNRLGQAYWQAGGAAQAAQAWQALTSSCTPEQPQPNLQFCIQVYRQLVQAQRAQGDIPAAIAALQALAALQPADADLRYELGLLTSTQEPEAAPAILEQARALDPALGEKAGALIDAARAARPAEDAAYSLLSAGRALGSLEEWELAAEAFRQSTLARPDYAEAWAFWGEALQHLEAGGGDPAPGDPTPGELLEKALALAPDSLAANTLLGLYWERQGDYSQALIYLQKAARLEPRNPALQTELGSGLALSGDLEAAEQAYRQAITLAPHTPLYFRLLAAFSIKYQYHLRETGLEAARQAVILDPEDAAALDVMGQCLFSLGDTLNAARFFERSLQSDPEDAAAHLHLGLAYRLQGEPAKAAAEFIQARSLAPGTPLAERAQQQLEQLPQQPLPAEP